MISFYRLPILLNLKFFIFIIVCSLSNFSVAGNKSTIGSKSIDNQFIDLSIEELMNIKVTTASRRPQKISEVPSAIFVITQDDIRRSGATSIPEALRMAPGVEVARIGTDKWAVSIYRFAILSVWHG